MRRRGGSLGCVLALTLLFLASVSVWVGVRLGTAAVARQAATAAEPPAQERELFGQKTAPPWWRTGHGAIGTVERVGESSITIAGRLGPREIKVSPETLIFRGDVRIQLSDITPGTRITVIGRPGDDGQLEARVLRIFSPDRKRRSEP